MQTMRFIRWNDYTWWLWLVIATCLAIGLLVAPIGILMAVVLSALQAVAFAVKERSLTSFAVQLRTAYLLYLLLCLIPPLTPLLWIPMLGTYALCFFGYCLLARCLSLLPWNRTSKLTLRELVSTFTAAPDLAATTEAQNASGCPGGVCTLDVQLARMRKAKELG